MKGELEGIEVHQVFADCIVLKKRSIFIFAYGKAGWVSSSQNWPFFVEIINV